VGFRIPEPPLVMADTYNKRRRNMKRLVLLVIALAFGLTASAFAQAPAATGGGKTVKEQASQDVKDIKKDAKKMSDSVSKEVKEQSKEAKESAKEVKKAAKEDVKKTKDAFSKDAPAEKKK
jgi:cytoskeletal protein RodZ